MIFSNDMYPLAHNNGAAGDRYGVWLQCDTAGYAKAPRLRRGSPVAFEMECANIPLAAKGTLKGK